MRWGPQVAADISTRRKAQHLWLHSGRGIGSGGACRGKGVESGGQRVLRIVRAQGDGGGWRKGKQGCGIRRRHLLEPALAVLALVPHPARVAEAGGVDTAAREAGAGPVARLGLGHLRPERQVEEAGA